MSDIVYLEAILVMLQMKIKTLGICAQREHLTALKKETQGRLANAREAARER